MISSPQPQVIATNTNVPRMETNQDICQAIDAISVGSSDGSKCVCKHTRILGVAGTVEVPSVSFDEASHHHVLGCLPDDDMIPATRPASRPGGALMQGRPFAEATRIAKPKIT
jgi:hypothetical protein